MNNEDLQPDGILDFKDHCPDIKGYRSITFQKVPRSKWLPEIPSPSPLPPVDPKSNYLTILASDDFIFVVKKDYILHCSQTVRSIMVNDFWPDAGKRVLSFMFIHPYYMTLICKYFNWAYYYGITHFKKRPPCFKIGSIAEAWRLQKIVNYLGC